MSTLSGRLPLPVVVVVCGLQLMAACGDDGDAGEAGGVAAVQLPTPQALLACENAPDDDALQARLWISGDAGPCFLDVTAAETTGRCTVRPGIERVFTVDWFTDVGGTEVILAQAQKTIDLAGATDDVALVIADDDIDDVACLDMRFNQVEGSATVDFNGAARPVCDLDDDGESNLFEVCAGGDPTGRL